MSTNQASKTEYALGHSEHEIKRLERQGDYFRDLTRDLFVRAGVRQGMRVLDYGGGAGDVAMLVSEIVGSSSEVVSFDRSGEAVSKARTRATERGFGHIRFIEADEGTLQDVLGSERFDAVVGRLILVFQKDPAAALRKVMRYVHTGGIVAFHEYDQDAGCWSQPRLPLFEQLFSWIIETFRRSGMVTDAGRVSRVFREAGVQAMRIVREGQVTDGTDPLAHPFLVDIMRTMLPLAEKSGVTTAAQVQIETLLDRLSLESTRAEARWIPAYMVAAWGRVPA